MNLHENFYTHTHTWNSQTQSIPVLWLSQVRLLSSMAAAVFHQQVHGVPKHLYPCQQLALSHFLMLAWLIILSFLPEISKESITCVSLLPSVWPQPSSPLIFSSAPATSLLSCFCPSISIFQSHTYTVQIWAHHFPAWNLAVASPCYSDGVPISYSCLWLLYTGRFTCQPSFSHSPLCSLGSCLSWPLVICHALSSESLYTLSFA